jgi:hypothetical protein
MAVAMKSMDGMSPIVFLDFDDVVVLNRKYGGYDVFAPNPPEEIWKQIFDVKAMVLLKAVLKEFDARVVITSSWLRLLDREAVLALCAKTGHQFLADALHGAWEAPQNRFQTRAQAIERWLASNHRGEAFVILDDSLSGTGLVGSSFDKAGRLVLCEVNVGLGEEHQAAIVNALNNVCGAGS